MNIFLWNVKSHLPSSAESWSHGHIPQDYNLSKPQKSHRCVDLTTGHSAIHFVVSDIRGVFCATGDGATCGTGWTDESSGALVSWRHVSTGAQTHAHISVSCAHLTGNVYLWAPCFLAVCQTSGCQSLKPRVGALSRSRVFLLLPWHHSKPPSSCPEGTSSAGNRRSVRDDRTLISRVQVAEELR